MINSHQTPSLNFLKTFESVARHLSFTLAAKELFITQAAVSHQIKVLEDYLGAKLFYEKIESLFNIGGPETPAFCCKRITGYFRQFRKHSQL